MNTVNHEVVSALLVMWPKVLQLFAGLLFFEAPGTPMTAHRRIICAIAPLPSPKHIGKFLILRFRRKPPKINVFSGSESVLIIFK